MGSPPTTTRRSVSGIGASSRASCSQKSAGRLTALMRWVLHNCQKARGEAIQAGVRSTSVAPLVRAAKTSSRLTSKATETN
jgi:hypothetical protein